MTEQEQDRLEAALARLQPALARLQHRRIVEARIAERRARRRARLGFATIPLLVLCILGVLPLAVLAASIVAEVALDVWHEVLDRRDRRRPPSESESPGGASP